MAQQQRVAPVFIVGAPRSGTTWLQLLLSQSPAIASCNETHLFSSYLASLFRAWPAFHKNARAIGVHHLMSEAEYFGAIRTLADSVLTKIVDSKPSAQVVLEKTPAHGRCWQSIIKIYPQARFVHLIRDPRSVVASLRRAGRGWGQDWASPGIVANAELWIDDVRSAQAIAEVSDRYYQLTYEALKADPAGEVASVFDFLDLSESSASCARYVDQCQKGKLEEGDQVNTLQQPWNIGSEPAGFFGLGRAEGWKQELRQSEIALIEHLTFPYAERFGYSRTSRMHRFHGRALLYRVLDLAARQITWQCSRLRGRL